MTKYVLVSDIHGNALALEQVMDAEGNDANYVVLGDIHGLNSFPWYTIQFIKSMKDPVVLAGNHDKALFHHEEGHVNNAVLSQYELDSVSGLSMAQKEWMRSLPFMKVWQDGPSRIAATHAYPWPEKASGYEQGNAGVSKAHVTSVAATVSDDYDWVFHGHTHEQYDLDCSRFGHDVHFVNPGSLGYSGTYSVVDTDSGEVQHKSVEWDHEQLKRHVQNGLPKGAPHTEEWL